jgi:transposase-like protein
MTGRGHKRTERNAAILRQYTSGMRVSDIAAAHDISASRVDQLIRDSGTPRRPKKPEKRAKPSTAVRQAKPQGPQITPDGVRLTICPSGQDYRFTVREVTEPLFSALGIGRYLDRDTATQRRLA